MKTHWSVGNSPSPAGLLTCRREPRRDAQEVRPSTTIRRGLGAPGLPGAPTSSDPRVTSIPNRPAQWNADVAFESLTAHGVLRGERGSPADGGRTETTPQAAGPENGRAAENGHGRRGERTDGGGRPQRRPASQAARGGERAHFGACGEKSGFGFQRGGTRLR